MRRLSSGHNEKKLIMGGRASKVVINFFLFVEYILDSNDTSYMIIFCRYFYLIYSKKMSIRLGFFVIIFRQKLTLTSIENQLITAIELRHTYEAIQAKRVLYTILVFLNFERG